MKRSPIRRSLVQMKRVALRPVSVKMAKKRAEAKPDRDAYLAEHPYCEAKKAKAPGACFGALHIHEVVPRGRGGDIRDRALFRAVCDWHNTAISQDADVMAWAYAAGFLFHAR